MHMHILSVLACMGMHDLLLTRLCLLPNVNCTRTPIDAAGTGSIVTALPKPETKKHSKGKLHHLSRMNQTRTRASV